MTKIIIRWNDGFLRIYDVIEWTPGCDYLWMKLSDGREKWIPTRDVRYFEVDGGNAA